MADNEREGAPSVALRHAVLAALLDGEYSGYQLAKAFDVGVANFWYALPQQLYAELAKLEKEGLVAGRQVVQEARPNKRLFRVTDAGLAELEEFAASVSKPSFIRDDLLVKVQAADHIGTAPVIEQLEERASAADARIELFGKLLRQMRGDVDEEEFLRRGERIGPYLTCLRGLAFEQGNRDWCLRISAVLRERRTSREQR
ncbi:DNA-binding transcriptional regulator, PadR family [Streptomyces sp. ok210]|nr:DNA-binding transcriptional regulator, PadR family [Streptomyces sp. ok210]